LSLSLSLSGSKMNKFSIVSPELSSSKRTLCRWNWKGGNSRLEAQMKKVALLTFVLLSVFLGSCIYRYTYELPDSSKKDFSSSLQRGETDYEGIIYWTPEYSAFIFQSYLDGGDHLIFPTTFAYEVTQIENDGGLFRSARKFRCTAARIRFRGTIMDSDEFSGMYIFLGKVKINKIYYYQLLNESQMSRILSGKSDSKNPTAAGRNP
jgi:hypothetical protein